MSMESPVITARMIRNGAGYGSKHLQYSDYLDEQHRITGQWMGGGAERLGISGPVANEALERLRVGRHPETGAKIRQRLTTETEHGRAFFDFTVSAPKTVSVQALVGDDRRLFGAHEHAVQATVQEMERLANTRVRLDGARTNRRTGNLVVAIYHHDTSRKLDPQLHAHCVVPNVTFDPVENRYKALEPREIFDHIPYLTEVYRNELAMQARAMGYGIEDIQDAKGRNLGFELAGVGAFSKRFSQRSDDRDQAIEAFASKHGRQPSKREIAVLVRDSREGKLIEIATADVREQQRARLSNVELAHLQGLKRGSAIWAHTRACSTHLTGKQALDHAQGAIFERVSVSSRREILTAALRFSRGRTSLETIISAYDAAVLKGELLSDKSGQMVSTKLALARERDLLDSVNRSWGKFAPLAPVERVQSYLPVDLADGQKRAILGILDSRDRVVSLQGAAGTGKTTVLEHIREHAKGNGVEVLAMAPTASAVSELRRAGFSDAVTIDRYLADPRLNQAVPGARGRLLIVDEAAMVGTGRMHQLVMGTGATNTRLLLVGDTKQLQSVDAGDALRIMQKDSPLHTFKLEEVFRQSGAYRVAIETLRHDPVAGFDRLEAMGAVQEVPADRLVEAAVGQYLHWTKSPTREGKAPYILTVCPTWADIKLFTDSLRGKLQSAGTLKGPDKQFTRYEAVKWGTLAEKQDLQNYRPGHVLVFHKETKHVAKGESITVEIVSGGKIQGRRANGSKVKITGKQAGCFSVFNTEQISVAAGDRLMLQANRTAPKAKGLQSLIGPKPFTVKNGELVTVKALMRGGKLKLTDGRVVPADYHQFTHGYAVTVHASQAKTVDRVLVFGEHMSENHFYVAASRARHGLAVYTSDRQRFAESITRSTDRSSAHDVVRARDAERAHLQPRPAPQEQALGLGR